MTESLNPVEASHDKKFEPSIQGLRGIAALSVLLVHLYDMPMNAGFLPTVPSWFDFTILTGGRGVELFFIISGYLIPASLVRHRQISKFFYERCMRILPVFVVFHLVIFIVGPIVGYKFFKGIDPLSYLGLFLANLFFLPDILRLPAAQQNAWTLTYEWLFYFWFAATFYFVTIRRVWVAAGLLVAAGLIAIAAFPIAAYFLVGVAIRYFDVRLELPGLRGAAAGMVCLFLMYVCLEYINPFLGLIPGYLLFAMVRAPTSGIVAPLERPVIQYIGKISYSLYLAHPFALFPLQMAGAKLAAHGYPLWPIWLSFAAVGLIVSFAMSAMTYELIEVRLRRVLDASLRSGHRSVAGLEA
ncbi:acyltransferase [Bradyrhizobium sp. Arg816]|uniref:acyltransferase family protein n=1 Tax=Bradyrhizobium sp. Arg816 TaxID=2998491 RepID=UPI00249DAC6E|nr:acyltransferase [Bradyrhizobium sp. Arg816]MDI3566436.1 acyltransferase [Bradyrhizobium sp. Arg816]